MKPSQNSADAVNPDKHTRMNSSHYRQAATNAPGRLLVIGCLLCAVAAKADSTLWVGGGADLNWATAGNWTNGVPSATTDAYFYTDGAVADMTVNNLVSDDVTVQTLRYLLDVNGLLFQNTEIADGKTLTVFDVAGTTNSFIVAAETSVATQKFPGVSFTGAGGVLDVNAPNGNIIVRDGGLSMWGGYAKLDLSGLGTFKASVKQMLLAGDGTNADLDGTGNRYKDRAACYVLLAKTNILELLDASGRGLIFANGIGNNAGGSTLKLGLTNAIFSDTGILLGGSKSGTSTVGFQEADSTAYFRGLDGTGPMAFLGIGDPSLGYGQGAISCTADFTLGAVDAWVNQLVVGRSYRDANKTGTSKGTLKLAAGRVVANSMLVGYDMTDFCAAIEGRVDISGTAELVVSNAMQLGRFRDANITSGFSLARLDIHDGGSVKVFGGLTSSFTNPDNFDSELGVSSGSLHVKGAMGPFYSLELNNSTLSLDINTPLSPTTALCYVTNLTTIAPITLNVAGAIPATGQFPLFQYATISGNAGDDITTFTLPAYVEGYLSNNVANSSIDLVVSKVLDSNIQFTQTSFTEGGVQLAGTCEWTNAPYRVIATTNVIDGASWVTVAKGAFTDGTFTFTDSTAANYPQRFYRVVTP